MSYASEKLPVRCCSNDNCGTCKSVCWQNHATIIRESNKNTFLEAQQICSENGMRLCTKKELASKMCCNTGCGLDGAYKNIWYAKEGNVYSDSQ